MHSLGLIRRPEFVRDRLASAAPYEPETKGAAKTILQPVIRIRNQRRKPSCVGHAIHGRRDSLVGGPPFGSAVDLWTDARRRDGNLGRADEGTYSHSAYESLVQRGTSSEIEGEDSRPVEEDTRIDTLTGELEAADHRIPETWEYKQISGSICPQVIDALERGLLVVFGAGVRGIFQTLARDEVVTTEHLGGNEYGHEQGIFGYVASRGLFLSQGSWGENFAGITLPDDIPIEEIENLFPCAYSRFLPGCFWLEPEVIEQAWDVDVLRVTP